MRDEGNGRDVAIERQGISISYEPMSSAIQRAGNTLTVVLIELCMGLEGFGHNLLVQQTPLPWR